MNSDNARPLRVYGSEISYVTGRLDGYLRYKEIPYERIVMTRRYFTHVVCAAWAIAATRYILLRHIPE
jgi:hypothetical protein